MSLTKEVKSAWADMGLVPPELCNRRKGEWEKETEKVFVDFKTIPNLIPKPTAPIPNIDWEKGLVKLLEIIPLTKPILKSKSIYRRQTWETEIENLLEELRFRPESILDFKTASYEKMPDWESKLKNYWENYQQFEKELPMIPRNFRALRRIQERSRQGEPPEKWEKELEMLLKKVTSANTSIPQKRKLKPIMKQEWENELGNLVSEIHKPFSTPTLAQTSDEEPLWEKFLWYHWCQYMTAQVPRKSQRTREPKRFSVSTVILHTPKEIWLPPSAPKVPDCLPEGEAFRKLILFGERSKEAKEREKSRLWPTSKRRKEQEKKERGVKKVGTGWMHVGRWDCKIEKIEQVSTIQHWSGRKQRRVDLIKVPNYNWVQERIRPASLQRWQTKLERFESRAGLELSPISKPWWMPNEDWMYKLETSNEFLNLLESENQDVMSGNPDLQKKFSKH